MNHRPTNSIQIAAILALMLLSLSGCKYDRSFMNMDSNSGSPFFGLQLAVDSGSRAPLNSRSAGDIDRPTPPFQRYPAIPEHSKSPDAALLQEHPGLLVWRPESTGFVEQFPAVQNLAAHIYLLDPLGNLMLRFPENPDPKGIMKDLKLLLKASQIG